MKRSSFLKSCAALCVTPLLPAVAAPDRYKKARIVEIGWCHLQPCGHYILSNWEFDSSECPDTPSYLMVESATVPGLMEFRLCGYTGPELAEIERLHYESHARL